jgi:preprotein translocase subunit SecG
MAYLFFSIIIVLAAIALVFIVLIQNSKGGGLASGFASSNQVMGVRKTTDFLEKATWALAGGVLVLSIITSAFVESETQQIQQESVMKEQIENAVQVNPNAVAPFGSQAPEATAPATPAAEQ